ncbi:MAG: polysaccharide deacetylase family protein [Patescibacteria group bacterium]
MFLPLLHRLLGRRAAPILLYHATTRAESEAALGGLHNVAPDILRRQLLWMRGFFDIVSLDAFFESPQPGKAAVTFDDGHPSVFREALPILRELQMPCTVFLNGSSLRENTPWRDRVRALLQQDLAEDFLRSYRTTPGRTEGLTARNFYRMSKTGAVNSRTLAQALDRFWRERGLDPLPPTGHVSPQDLPKDSLVTYGNHTLHHYVLSSLSEEEQREEILGNQRLLEEWGFRCSRVFSLPFGNAGDCDAATFRILREAGYEGIVYSRNRLNFPRHVGRDRSWPRHQELPLQDGLVAAERAMAPATLTGLQKQFLGMWARRM